MLGKGRMVIIFGTLFFVIWAIFAPLGQGVPAPGVVKVESNRKVIQHFPHVNDVTMGK